MVARSPAKQQRKMAPHLSPTLLRETVKKVDKCMARLQELQYTVTGGTNKGYLRTSLHCKQESLRIKNVNCRRSPPGKLPVANTEDWRRMSLPAMLLGETMGELLQATQFARNIVNAATATVSYSRKPATTTDDPKTPVTQRRNQKTRNDENSGVMMMQVRRRREKQVVLRTIRSESNTMSSSLQRAKSRINFKVSSSPLQNNIQCDKENCRYIANRVSPRNRPWARKTVLFPNPLFHPSSPISQHHKFLQATNKSPVSARNRQTPHKFLIKSPPAAASSKFQVKIKSPPISISPTRANSLSKKSPKASSAAAMMRRSFSPSRLANRLVSPLKGRKSVQKNEESKFSEMERNRQIAHKFLIKSSSPPGLKFQGKGKSTLVSTSPTRTTSLGKKSPKGLAAPKLRRSFSPSRLANRLVSPLKTRNYIQKNQGMTAMGGVNQRPISSSARFSSPQRI